MMFFFFCFMAFCGGFEEIKNRLMFQIVSTEGNKEILSKLPHFELEDMSVVIRVDMGACLEENTTMLVTNEMMDFYGITAMESQLADCTRMQKKPHR